MNETRSPIDEHTAPFLATARSLDDPLAPSRCSGWSRGRVRTHLARDAGGAARWVRTVTEGAGESMDASDTDRDADVAAGGARPLPGLVVDYRLLGAEAAHRARATDLSWRARGQKEEAR